jgi:murein DD-endopeptidase MepM/ murein hydrolase activator NlpD
MFKELVKIKVFPVVSVVVGSVFLASCSSGVSRFDYPAFGLSSSDDQNTPTSSLSGGSRLGQGMDAQNGLAGFESDRTSEVTSGGLSNYNTRNSYLPPQTAAPEVRSARYNVVERAPLASIGRSDDGRGQTLSAKVGKEARGTTGYDAQPMKPIREARRSFLPSEPSGYNYNSHRTIRKRPVVRRTVPKAVVGSMNTASKGNQSIQVVPGDTLYSIGRRYKVSVVKLMEINNLSDSNLTAGQQLIVPGNGGSVAALSTPTAVKQVVRATTSGTYTVRRGESFRKIAGKFGVKASELADLNGITDPGSIRPGEVLILPANAHVSQKMASLGGQVARKNAGNAQAFQVRSVKTRSIKLGTAKSNATSVSKKQVSVARKRVSKKTASHSAFRWPVRGRIIEKFGPRRDGTHNDGINLAVPNGTQVKAAEAGVVAYAGSELEGYGNLVLIRHANDWVSAYAHNDRLLVKRGDKIKRGQVVARAGTSGSVEQPQVHFELRKGSKPVDPEKYMAGT